MVIVAVQLVGCVILGRGYAFFLGLVLGKLIVRVNVINLSGLRKCFNVPETQYVNKIKVDIKHCK